MSVILTKDFFIILENIRENYSVSGLITQFISLHPVTREAALSIGFKTKKKVRLTGTGPGIVASESSTENGCGEGGQRWGQRQCLLKDKLVPGVPRFEFGQCHPLQAFLGL